MKPHLGNRMENIQKDKGLKSVAVDIDVSVVVPSYNSCQYIRECLTSLRNQNCETNYETILVDSSDDETAQIVTEEFPEVKLIQRGERTFVGTARNIGIGEAKGEIILFIDTDCIAPPHWVDRMHKAITSSKADGVGGALQNGTPTSITGTVGYYLEFFRFFPDCHSKNYDKLEETSFLVGANCGFRKILFDKIKYYDGFDAAKVGEDFYFCWQLLQQSKKLVFAPGIAVIHQNKTGMAKIMSYQNKFGVGACYYRYHVSKDILSIFLRFPLISFLIPLAVIPWIGYFVIKRLGLVELIKYVILLPLVFMGNYFWAYGFFKEAKSIRENITEK